MFSQSNFGVVTKMGFWLMPEPDAYLSGTVTVFRHDDLIPLVNILNYLENTRVTNGMPDLASPLLGIPMLSEFAARFDQGSSPFDRPQDPELTALVAKAGGNMSPELDDYAAEEGRRLLELQAELLWRRQRPTPRTGRLRRRNSPPFPARNSRTENRTSSR